MENEHDNACLSAPYRSSVRLVAWLVTAVKLCLCVYHFTESYQVLGLVDMIFLHKEIDGSIIVSCLEQVPPAKNQPRGDVHCIAEAVWQHARTSESPRDKIVRME
jgi:hypothetical protein